MLPKDFDNTQENQENLNKEEGTSGLQTHSYSEDIAFIREHIFQEDLFLNGATQEILAPINDVSLMEVNQSMIDNWADHIDPKNPLTAQEVLDIATKDIHDSSYNNHDYTVISFLEGSPTYSISTSDSELLAELQEAMDFHAQDGVDAIDVIANASNEMNALITEQNLEAIAAVQESSAKDMQTGNFVVLSLLIVGLLVIPAFFVTKNMFMKSKAQKQEKLLKLKSERPEFLPPPEKISSINNKMKAAFKSDNRFNAFTLRDLEGIMRDLAIQQKYLKKESLSNEISEYANLLEILDKRLDDLAVNRSELKLDKELITLNSDLMKSLSEQYYGDLVTNESFWDDAEARRLEVRSALGRMTDLVKNTVLELNKYQDTTVRFSLRDIIEKETEDQSLYKVIQNLNPSASV